MAPIAFSGALQPKKKSELQAIAVALRVSDVGTKDELQSRIKNHLDKHPALEDNPQFAGLYGRRRRSVQPQPAPASAVPSRFVPPSSEKPTSRITPLEPIRESTPAKDLRDVSTFLKRPISPVNSTPNQSPRQVDVITPSSLPPLPPSPAKSLIEHIPNPADVKAAVQRFHQQELLPNGTEFLEATRVFLSNSRNIWTITALFEALYILSTVIPWKVAQLSLSAKADGPSLTLPYPPLSVFQTSAFWMVLVHWIIPTLVFPALIGNLISFNPSHSSSSSQPGLPPPAQPFDPLTAAIIRLAASIAYPYDTLSSKEHIYGLDVLGYNLRVFDASVGLAFAFAEAIAGAPQLFAKTLAQEHHLAITATEDISNGRALTARDDLSDEVD